MSVGAPRDPRRAHVVSLELLLDADSEAHIRAEWDALAAAGFSSLAGHTAPSNRPHVTLLVRPSVPTRIRDEVRRAVTLPLPLTIGAPVLFGTGDRRVLARSVVPSQRLLDLHAALHALVGGGSGDDAPHTRPGEWMPHITLARRLRLASLPDALRHLDAVAPTEASAFAVALRRWDSEAADVTALLP